MIKYLTLSMALGLSTLAVADTACRTVNLSSSSAELGMARNQRSLGWCFAYSMADIVGHELGHKISPFDIAISLYRTHPAYNIKNAELVSSIGGGNPVLTYRALEEIGVCPEEKVSASGTFSASNLPVVEKLAKEAAELTGSSSQIHLKLLKMFTDNQQAFNSIFPTSSMEETVNALSHLGENDQPLVSLVDNICEERESIKNLSFGGGVYPDPREAASRIRTQLNNGKPVMIGYNADTLRDITKGGGVNHASTIIGMRPNKTGTCDYLLRNSWGNVRRDYYDPSLRQNFSEGNLWVPHEVLTKSLHWSVWLNKN